MERLPAVSEAFGLSPHRPDGKINGFAASPGREGEHGCWTGGRWCTASPRGPGAPTCGTPADVFLSAGPRDDWDFVRLSLDSVHCRRVPDVATEPFRELHRLLTDLWSAPARETGAVFGRVEDEWSLEQIRSELDDPAAVDPVRFARLHHEYRRAVRVALDRAAGA